MFDDSLILDTQEGVIVSPILHPELAGINPMMLSSLHDSNFPGINQTDHPTLSTPCWWLHPCETSHAVVELLKSRLEDDKGFPILSENLVAVWMETWFAVVSGVIRLDTGLIEH